MKPIITATILPVSEKEVGVSISTCDFSAVPNFREMISGAAPGEEQQFVELILAVNFAIRQLSNHAHGPFSDSLVQRLRNLRYEERDDITSLDDPLVIVNSPPKVAASDKRIGIELFMSDTTHQLTIKSAGFGFWDRKLSEYIPASVMGLYIALAARRPGERGFIRRLLVSAMELTRQWQLRRVTLSNHGQICLTTVLGVWGIPIDGKWEDDRPQS